MDDDRLLELAPEHLHDYAAILAWIAHRGGDLNVIPISECGRVKSMPHLLAAGLVIRFLDEYVVVSEAHLADARRLAAAVRPEP